MANYGLLARQGRREDNALMGGQVAHISAAEAEMLRRMGGAGTINPVTGLLEYYSAASFGGVTGGSYGGPGPGTSSGSVGNVGFQTEGGGGMGFVVGGGEGQASPSALGGSVAAGDTSYDAAGNWIGAPTFGEVYAAETFAPNSPMNTANPFAAYNMGYSPYTAAPPSMTWGEAAAVLGPIAFSLATGGIPAAVFSLGTTVAQAMAKGGTFGKAAKGVANAIAGITGAPQGGESGSVSYAKTGASKGGIGSFSGATAPGWYTGPGSALAPGSPGQIINTQPGELLLG